jgi:hypothetical protein
MVTDFWHFIAMLFVIVLYGFALHCFKRFSIIFISFTIFSLSAFSHSIPVLGFVKGFQSYGLINIRH